MCRGRTCRIELVRRLTSGRLRTRVTNRSFDATTRRKLIVSLNLGNARPENSCHQSKCHQLVKSAADGTAFFSPAELGARRPSRAPRLVRKDARPHKPHLGNCGRCDAPIAISVLASRWRLHRPPAAGSCRSTQRWNPPTAVRTCFFQPLGSGILGVCWLLDIMPPRSRRGYDNLGWACELRRGPAGAKIG